jgi:TonB family protein
MSTTRACIAVALALLCAGPVAAQEAGPPPGAQEETGAAPKPDDGQDGGQASDDAGQPDQDGAPAPAPPPRPEDIERPRLLRDAQPRYPAAAWDAQIEADVVLLLNVDAEGQVTAVVVDTPAGHGFDEAAVRAARDLRFTPARVAGAPVPIQIRYTFRFRIPEKETVARRPLEACTGQCPVDERAPARMRATVYERGRGKRLPGVEVYVLDRDEVLITDQDGQFTLEGPPGAYAFVIRPPDFYPFETTERLEPGQEVEIKYFVRRQRRARYTTIVWGAEGRAEVARTSLSDDEIRSIPGTLGDPIRVAMLLPGVITPASGIGYPIVRGALPGDSIYEVDGIPVPMLYHLFFGNAVIHPRFVDEITFQPGGYGAAHGRFPGGRIAATTAKVDDDPRWVANLSLVETSLLRAQPVGQSSEFVAAARYGTLGYIIEGLAANTVFRYWDYQTRLAHRFGDGGKLSLTVLGAQDTAGERDPETGEESVLRIAFHTADLRYRRSLGSLGGQGWLVAGVQGGHELFAPPPPEDLSGDTQEAARMWKLRPYLEGGVAPGHGLELEAGADLLYQNFDVELFGTDDPALSDADSGVTLGAWLAAEWQRGPVLVNPGVRVDHYRYQAPGRIDRATAVEPRLAASYALTSRITTKASVGLHSGPARFSFVEPPLVFGPIPAYEGPGLYWGLNRTWQTQAGVETRLPGDLALNLTGFYHDMFQAIDFSLLDKPLTPDPTPCDGEDITPVPVPEDVDGKSYGLELLLRRRLGHAFFGWVSYSMSRSERTLPVVGTLPFDFDQTHVLNTVLSWDVGRNWTVGGVLHVNTGRPYTPLVRDRCTDDSGVSYFDGRRGEPNAERFPLYWRIDARIQKREVFETWYFDFYVDLFNASFNWETIGYTIDADTGALQAEIIPLFIPMIGVRGEF